jgi:ectoine hydroxylase
MTTATLSQPSTKDPYPSRHAPEPQLVERQDPVVYGEPRGGLSALHRRAHETRGFLAFPGFLHADELRTYQEEAERLRTLDALAGRPEVITEPGGGEVRSVFEVHKLSEVIDRLSRHPKILNVVTEILGGDVYLHQSRVNYKPGFRGKEFYWHSDFETWHLEDGMPRMRAVSCSISLTENTPFNGPLMLIPGSHQIYVSCVGETPENHYESSLKKQEYGVPDDQSLARLVEAGGIEAPTGPAGSATFFDCNTMHGSNSNISPLPRTNVFFVYNSVENTLVEPFSGQKPRPGYIADRGDASPLVAA